ncbi:MAG: class I SAM-dependent methyltransferase [Planctomycetes bacterium]|nr:class I SAM-dependent methyltransferase [Planctomycetota bacterium]
MRLPTLLSLLFGARGRAILRVARYLPPFYRACYVASLAENGMLGVLASAVVPFEELVARFCPTGNQGERDALDAWLGLGVSLKELKGTAQGYGLRGRLSRQLSRPENDAALALLQSMVRHHHRFLTESLTRLRSGTRFTLADLDGQVVARAARALEPVVLDALNVEVPCGGPFQLLDIGCGSAGYLRHAAARNHELTALGLELQPELVDAARRNVAAWDLAERVRIEAADVRKRTPEAVYDLVTLHNNVYYFPVDARVSLLRHLRGFLKPAGRILVTTHCVGTSSGACIGLFAALTEGCGRLPRHEEMIAQLHEAGYEHVKGRQLIPCDPFVAFTAANPLASVK